MNTKKKIIGICGSASKNSGNLTILEFIGENIKPEIDFEIIDDLSIFPHFSTEQTDNNVPEKIMDFRNKIFSSDGVIICTPEYIFSIPSRLKNIIEWCVSTTVFSDKPAALITASTSGEKGHEELKLLMKTIQTFFTDDTVLLIQGLKGKVSKGELIDNETKLKLRKLMNSFNELIRNN